MIKAERIRYLRISTSWLILWLLWPFGALLQALSKYRTINAKTVFWLFCVYFGMTMIIPEDIAGASDAASYATALQIFHARPFSLNVLWDSFYNRSGGFVDIYQPLVTWLVATFTDDSRWLFALFASVFGFFYAQNLWMIFDRIKFRGSRILLFFILGMALVNPIWQINGVRMWTAAQIFLYGNLILFLREDKRGLIWSAIAILVHFSFLFPVALLVIYLFLPKRTWLFFGFYIAATFVNEINLTRVNDLLSTYLPSVFQAKVDTYTNEQYAVSVAEAKAMKLAWYTTFNMLSGKIIIYAWVIVLFLTRKSWLKIIPEAKNLFDFALYIGGWAQLASLVPSGVRFNTLANSIFFIVFVLIVARKHLLTRFNTLAKITSPLVLFTIVFNLRVGAQYSGLLTLFGNPILASIFREHSSLVDYIKLIF